MVAALTMGLVWGRDWSRTRRPGRKDRNAGWRSGVKVRLGGPDRENVKAKNAQNNELLLVKKPWILLTSSRQTCATVCRKMAVELGPKDLAG